MAEFWTLDGYGAYLVTAFAAVASSSAELLTRYRDEPWEAIANRYGFFYLSLNALVACFVYNQFGWEIDSNSQLSGTLADNISLNAIGVGLGAMVLLRSKLFTLRTENGTETAFGPAAVVDAFFFTIDREIDRRRASTRHTDIWECFKDIGPIDDDKLSEMVAFYEMSLYAFQNLSNEEKAALVKIFQTLKTKNDWSQKTRAMAISFAVYTTAGKKHFNEMIPRLMSVLN